MKNLNLRVICVYILLILLPINLVFGQNSIKLGAYYFDGWTGHTYHATDKLKKNFSEREPVWGWVTSTPNVMESQIDLASDAGISFFNFCWYDTPAANKKGLEADPKNNALNLFLKAKNKSKLQYSILVVNNGSYAIDPKEWDDLCSYWLNLFKDPAYLKVEGKPLITFFDIPSLVKSFGNPQKVKEALNLFRKRANENNLSGLSIAATFGSKPASIKLAQDCDFDIITGYNYAAYGLKTTENEIVPIDSMSTSEERVWDGIKMQWKKPIIPAITLNWDRRPWAKTDQRSPRFSGYSGESVKRSILTCRSWIKKNETSVVPEKIAILYAWNEYGEGAWLTPSRKLKNSLLEGVKAGLLEK